MSLDSPGSRGASSVAPSIANSVGTLKSTPTRKKRTIVVVRRPLDRGLPESGGDDDSAASPKKKTLLVARRPRASEGRLFEDETTPHGGGLVGGGGGKEGDWGGGAQRGGDNHTFSSTVAAKLEWLPDGHVLDRSVLGTAAAFEEMDAKLRWAPRPGEEDEEGSLHLLHRAGTSSRSLQSLRSKQSFRSLKSGGRQSTGDRSANGQGSRPGTGTSPDDRTDLQREMERYFRRITGAEDTAIRNRAATLRKEAKLMEHVGLTEKLTIRREGNSMRQWKRRQRDWQRVSEDMAAKTGKVPEDLVMSTADEYRERSEEYQLIQCAIPTHEKFSSDGYWVMSLRGFGDRKVNVGNIFSGLTCSINDRTPPPRAVRKPTGRPADATRKRTWRNSEALAATKRHLAPTLGVLRPQRFRPDETGGLLVQGQNLLEWAATSSREYFQLRHLQESEAVIAGLEALAEENRHSAAEGGGDPLFPPGSGERADAGAGSRRASARRTGPAMEVLSPQTLLIESSAGSKTLEQATVTVRNTGSTVLFFSWSRVPRGENVVSANGAIHGAAGGGGSGSGEGGIDQGNVVGKAEAHTQSLLGEASFAGGKLASAAARHAALQNPEKRFFCVQTTGTLLPGETATTSFSFKSADPGVFSDRWRLETSPPADFVFSTPPPPPPSNVAASAAAAASQSTHDPERALLVDSSDGGGEETALGKVSAGRRSHQDGGGYGGVGGTGGEGRAVSGVVAAAAGGSASTTGGGGGGGRGGDVGVEVGLRGVALAPDTRGHARKRLADGVTRGVMAAKVEEIVREVVGDVRTPVREEEIRRRQRKAFLALNAERGLYFTPRLYDGFMSLLQRAKAAALNAEEGNYDIDHNEGGDPGRSGGDDVAARTQQGAQEETEGDGEAVATADTEETLAAVALSLDGIKGQAPAGKGADSVGGGGEEGEAGDRSDCSTRPVSARSSSGGNDDDGNDEGRENEGEVSDGDQQDGNNDDVDAAMETPPVETSPGGPLAVPGEATGPTAAADREAEEGAESTDAATDRKECITDSEGAGGGGGGGGPTEESEESRTRAVEALLLRQMLERLDCGEWDGAVSTVLDAIESLTRWIPPPPPPPSTSAPLLDLGAGSPADGASGKASGGDPDPRAGLAPTSSRSGSGGEDEGDSDGLNDDQRDYDDEEGEDGDEENGEEDEEDGEDEEDEEDEEEEEEEEEEGEGDDESEDEAGQHPVLVEQKTLREQWRRLVLDAQLEPETDCTSLMRELIESTVSDVAGAVEAARRATVASLAGAGGKSAAAASAAAEEVQTPRGGVLGYDEESIANWAAACPPGSPMHDVEGGPQARAAAAAKAGNHKAGFLALAYGEVASGVAAAAEAFETGLASAEGARRSAAASTRRGAVLEGPDDLLGGGGDAAVSSGDNGWGGGQVPRPPPPPSPPLARLGALKWEDIEGRRTLLHVDLSRGVVEKGGGGSTDLGGVGGSDGRGVAEDGGDSSGGGPLRPFPEAVRLVAEQVREMLSAKPAAVAIVSEMSPPSAAENDGEKDGATPHSQPSSSVDPEITGNDQHPSPTSGAAGGAAPAPPESATFCSLRPTAAAISSLLGMEVDFYDSVPDLAVALRRCGERSSRVGGNGGGDSPPAAFGMVPLMMVERLSLPGVVPAPPVEEPELSDAEEERLPDFSWGGEEAEAAAEQAKKAEAARLAIEGPGEGDLGALLAGAVDIVVMDAPRALYEPRRELPWGPAPTTGLTVAGSGLHGDLTAMAYLTECPDKPLLAIVGGSSLEPRLKLIDGLLDLVDTLAVGGGLAATFIAAAAGTVMDTAKYIIATAGSGGAGAATEAEEAEARRREQKERVRRWTGKGTAGRPRDPPDVVVAARRLLIKARKRGVEVILPSDFVVGDIEVDENGPLLGQALADGDDDNNEDADDDGDDGANADGDASGGGGGGGGEEGVEGVVDPPDLEPEDPAMGFEYDGETMDVSLEDGIPKGFRPMDIGPQTTAALRDAVSCARTVLWHGMLGVAECSAFQIGTRDVLEAAVSAHDNDELREAGTSPVVILCGRSLGEWAGRFAEVDDDVPTLGSGSGVSHICTDPVLCSRVLEGRIVPGLSQLSERDPPPANADLSKVLRRGPFGDELEDGEDEEAEEDEDSDTSSS